MGLMGVLTMPIYMGGLGFRDTQLFNLAMLSKQARKLLQDPDSLSTRILQVVYYSAGNVLEAKVGSHPFQI